MKSLPRIILFIAVGLAVFLLAQRCVKCTDNPTETKTETTTTEIPGEVKTETPPPTIQVPHVDSSIFKQLERYKRLWASVQAENLKAEKYWDAVLQNARDTTLDLQSRYDVLLRGFETQKERHEVVIRYSQDLERKLEETANGNYVTEGRDSAEAYTMDWIINSFGPLKKDGFKRVVNVTQKTVMNTITKTEYADFSIGAIYSYSPDNLQIYSLQFGKDWKRFGLISQIGFTNDRNPVFSGGFKVNL
jgi:hypothetical protein